MWSNPVMCVSYIFSLETITMRKRGHTTLTTNQRGRSGTAYNSYQRCRSICSLAALPAPFSTGLSLFVFAFHVVDFTWHLRFTPEARRIPHTCFAAFCAVTNQGWVGHLAVNFRRSYPKDCNEKERDFTRKTHAVQYDSESHPGFEMLFERARIIYCR